MLLRGELWNEGEVSIPPLHKLELFTGFFHTTIYCSAVIIRCGVTNWEAYTHTHTRKGRLEPASPREQATGSRQPGRATSSLQQKLPTELHLLAQQVTNEVDSGTQEHMMTSSLQQRP